MSAIVNKGSHTTQAYRAAYILLNTDEGEHSRKVSNEQICKVLRINMRTIDRVKKRFVEEGLEATVELGYVESVSHVTVGKALKKRT